MQTWQRRVRCSQSWQCWQAVLSYPQLSLIPCEYSDNCTVQCFSYPLQITVLHNKYIDSHSHSHSPRSKIESHFPFSSIHHCYCHTIAKGCSQHDTSNEAPKGSTCTHTEAVTFYMRGEKWVAHKDENASTRLILYTTHDSPRVPYYCHPYQ